MENEYIKVSEQLPPEDVVVFTKIDDERGIRNEGPLIYSKKLWWVKDGSAYVYYRPTHWKKYPMKSLKRIRANVDISYFITSIVIIVVALVVVGHWSSPLIGCAGGWLFSYSIDK